MRFLRNTHINGVFREELRDVQVTGVNPLHFLSPTEPMSFDDVYREMLKYGRDNHEDTPHPHEVTYGLVRLLEQGMAKVVP